MISSAGPLTIVPHDILKRHDPEGRLTRFFTILKKENERLNLVSRETTTSGLVRLAAESLVPFELIERRISGRYLDIGSGGGIPAIPIMTAMPMEHTTLVERSQNKAAALSRILLRLELRAEIIRRPFPEIPLETPYDLVTLRLVKLTKPLCRAAWRTVLPEGLLIVYSSVPDHLLPPNSSATQIQYRHQGEAIVKTVSVIFSNRSGIRFFG